AKELNSAVTVNLPPSGYTQVMGKNVPEQGLNVVGNLGNTLMYALTRVMMWSPSTTVSESSPLFSVYKAISSGLAGREHTGTTVTSQDIAQAFNKQVCFGITTLGKNDCGGTGLIGELKTAGATLSYFEYMKLWMENNKSGWGFQNSVKNNEGDTVNGNRQTILTAAYNAASATIQGITKAALQLNNFNAANASGTLSTAEFTGLVDGIISTSSEALQNLKVAGMANGQVGLSTHDVIYNNMKSSSNTHTLENMNNFINNTQNTLTKLIQANDNLKAHPWLGQFAAGNSKQTNAMSGFYTKIGYKQFFGKKKAFGLRYYGFFSYNGAGVGNGANYNTVNLLTYGVGTDVLYNVFSRSFGSRSIDAGFFTGIQLAGDSYITSLAKSIQVDTKKVTATKFQFLFDVGMRMNFGILKKDMKKHNQHSIEIGVQIPTIYNTYYSNGGTEVKYYRPYSVYWVYGYAF
ncbi:outer membrane protein, partial [Helicobacter cetorum]|uniref:outer membrane protein n=1 Tax=Helicobacter cetorum TaxID=138563 RepID=UPI001F2E3DFE